MRRGATRHAHRPARRRSTTSSACATPASTSSSAGTATSTLQRCRSDRAEPGRAAAAAGDRGGARRRRAGHRRAGAGLALAARPDRRDHRHQGQVDDDDADRADARGGRPPRAGRRQHRPRAERAGGRVDRRTRSTSSRRAAFSSRAPRRSRRGSRCCSTSRPTTSIGTRPSRSTPRPRRGSSRTRPRDDWAVLNADDPRGAGAGGAAARARRLLFSLTRRAVRTASSCPASAIVRRTPTASSGRWCRWRRSSCSGRTWSPTCSRRRRWRGWPASTPDAMTRAVEGFTGLEHALEPVGRGRRRPVRQRLEGHQHRSGAPGDRELRPGLVVIMGGRFKGGDFGDLRRAARRERQATVVAIGEARPLIARRSAARVAGARRRGHARRRCARRSRRRRRAASSCSRRPARASTCSATTRSAAACSSRKCCGCRRSGTARVSSEQSSVRLVR